jgi:hypothetical protein
MLPSEPPKYTSWSQLVSSIKEGEKGWRPFALQSALKAADFSIVNDGDFGPRTLAAVKSFQSSRKLTADGVAGAMTQAALLGVAGAVAHEDYPRIPDGLLRGFAEAEGANVLAATNWFTPVGGKPGVDCGPVQWRLYGPPFDQDGLKKAFHPVRAFRFASRLLLGRIDNYKQRRPSLSSSMLLRLAVLAHNAPFMSEQVVRNGRLSTPNALATWTNKPGGGHYTHAEWMQVYPDKVMKYVS